MEIELQQLTKRFDSVVAVDDLNLQIRDGEFVAFLGPSGCGKTTTLLMIAGIYKLSSGHIVFDGNIVDRTPPRERNLGMVFQSYALYPHMTAYENITFPLKLKGISSKEQRERANRISEVMGIGSLLDRKPGQLSGGQQQRVALGRALIKEPSALLFDEPLSNLDARLRLTMRTEIKRLQNELGITSIFVTHDQSEALTMADRIAIMNEGKLQSFLPPKETYDRPPTRFVAGFVGNPPMNFMDIELVQRDGAFHVRRTGLDFVVSEKRGRKAAGRSKSVVLGIRPEDLHVNGTGVQGKVLNVEPLGRETLLVVDVDGIQLHALTHADTGLKMGDSTALQPDPDKVQFFDRITGDSLLWE